MSGNKRKGDGVDTISFSFISLVVLIEETHDISFDCNSPLMAGIFQANLIYAAGGRWLLAGDPGISPVASFQHFYSGRFASREIKVVGSTFAELCFSDQAKSQIYTAS